MEPPAQIWERVRAHAINSLSARQREHTNLSLDFRVWRKGEPVGPQFQKIVLREDGILVWADDEPLANFGHDCRYLLYDAKNGKFRRSLAARFPPYTDRRPPTLKYIHRSISPQPYEQLELPPWLKAAATLAKKDFFPPPLTPSTRRFAILFSGMTEMRDLNTLEFCYRMLKDHYGFAPADIQVLNYDGTFNSVDGVPNPTWPKNGKWPGNETDYQIKTAVTGTGNRAGWQAALNAIKVPMAADAKSLLFVLTTGHGDRIESKGSFMTAFPNEQLFFASEFSADLSSIIQAPFGSLIVLMEPCLCGGFKVPLMEASHAETSIAAAADDMEKSHGTADLLWQIFACNWIAAQFGCDVDLQSVVNADLNPPADGAIQSDEAYRYAETQNAAQINHDLVDTPTFAYSANGSNLTLSLPHPQTVPMAPTFVTILRTYVPPTTPAWSYYATLKRIQPRLQELMLPILNRTQKSLEREITAAIEPTIAAAFKPRKRRPPKKRK